MKETIDSPVNQDNGLVDGTPLEITSGLTFGQRVWVLRDLSICEGRCEGIKGETTRFGNYIIQIKVSFTFGQLGVDEYIPLHRVFTTREELVAIITGV
jgi:uncharacterized protein (UPF0248 family)